MNKTILGLIIGAALAFAGLEYGFAGLILLAIFMALGAAAANLFDGDYLNLKGAWESLFNRGSSSR